LTASHLWHFLVPTWEAQSKSKFTKQAQVNYLHHVKTMGYQPWKIRIETELEVEVFLTTVALCFSTKIELVIQNTSGDLVRQTVDPCGVTNTIYLSKRVTMDNLPCIEMWLPVSFLKTYITEAEKVFHYTEGYAIIFLSGYPNTLPPVHKLQKCISDFVATCPYRTVLLLFRYFKLTF
jgi:hypothetical protein